VSRSVRFEEFGPASVLKVVDVDEPHAGPGQVRVAVKAAALNSLDSKVRNGQVLEWIPITPPSTLGHEYAGVVDEVGDGVSGRKLGDQVFGSAPFVALAEYQVLDPATVAAKPENVSWAIAASIHVAGTTGYNSVRSLHLGADDTVLISAAAGGVGAIAVQLARMTGATVIGTASEANHEYLISLGAIPVSYGPGLAERVLRVAPAGITAALENNGVEAIETAIQLGVPANMINSIVNTMTANEYGPAIGQVGGSADVPTLTAVAELIGSGQLTIPLEGVFPVEQIVAAFERLDAGHLRGKVVVEF
jgi:NADPH:quinone reductase-like Zn-dependent oxidoreductase